MDFSFPSYPYEPTYLQSDRVRAMKFLSNTLTVQTLGNNITNAWHNILV